MPKLRVHIGHHFYGSGNLGDDLMLAGFLAAARPAFLARAAFTCCTPHDADCQRLRFPEIEWLPYDDATRAGCIARCDVWLGLGDTPFQATGGRTWFLDHLGEEAAWCRAAGVPMFYLGVGVNERATVDLPQTRRLVEQAERIWMRDDDAVGMLEGLARPGQATAHADLAHLALAAMRFPDPDPDALGLVLNFEDPAQFHPDALAALVAGADRWHVRWLAQEIRALPGAETFLHGLLPAAWRARVPLLKPDYAGASSARALLTGWEGLGALFTSRYHAALIGAWMGARVAVFARNDKVAGAAGQLGLSVVADMGDTPAILRALREFRPVERPRLLGLADRAGEACEDFFALAGVPRSRPAPRAPFSSLSASVFSQPPKRLLFLRPDAYGDLVLFEPVPRLVRSVWPEVEIAVLIRKGYEDIIPLLGCGGDVLWLTTDCNPYRESPGANPAGLAALRETVRAFAPDCLVAACAEPSWLEAAVASFLPEARQIGLGEGFIPPVTRAALDAALPIDWAAIYPEKIPVELESQEWEKNLRLAGTLLGREVPRWWPAAQVPDAARERAAQILADAGLTAGAFAVCAAAGTANVRIKSWPAEHYGDTLASLENERGIRALLVGHASERDHLEAVRRRAREGGADPALWTGQDGEMAVLAGLLATSRFYLGNDTGALHLAAALGRPVLPVFGGGNWLRFRPVARRSAVVVQPLPCFGCGWNCYFGDAPCVLEIPVGAVRRALEWLLASDEDAQIDITVEDAIPPKALELIRKTTDALRPQADRNGSGGALSQKALADLFKQLDFSEIDRAERLAAIEKQGAEIARLHAEAAELWPRVNAAINERNLLAAQLQDLRGHFERNAADHAARLQVIEGQGVEIGRLHAEAAELWPRVNATENERNLLAAQLADLRRQFDGVESDNTARLQVIERQGAEISRLQAEAAELWPKLDAAINEHNLLAAQLQDLRGHFERSEADNAARGKVIQDQGAEISRLHAEAAELWPRLEAARHELNLRTAQLADLRGHFERSETDRAARLELIESQGVELGELRARFANTATELAGLYEHFKLSEADRVARLEVIASQGAELGKLQAQLASSVNTLADLRARFERGEAEGAARRKVIEEQGMTITSLQKQLAAARGESAALQARQDTLDRHWTARLLKKIGLWPL